MARLADDLLLAVDPAAFGEACNTAFDNPGPLDSWQRGLLQSTAKRLILNCARQSGKSSIVAILVAVWVAIYESPALVLLLSKAEKQSRELLRKVRAVHAVAPGAPEVENESELRIEFRNGSRCVALPGTPATARSFSAPKLILVDEAGQVDDALFTSVRPMLAVAPGARLVYLSTPWGKRGEFHKIWTRGNSAWQRVMVKASECPRITAEFLEEQRREMAPWEYSQEFECEFADDGQVLFPSYIVERMKTDEVRSIWGSARARAA